MQYLISAVLVALLAGSSYGQEFIDVVYDEPNDGPTVIRFRPPRVVEFNGRKFRQDLGSLRIPNVLDIALFNRYGENTKTLLWDDFATQTLTMSNYVVDLDDYEPLPGTTAYIMPRSKLEQRILATTVIQYVRQSPFLDFRFYSNPRLVPEPSAALLLGLGSIFLAGFRRHRVVM